MNQHSMIDQLCQAAQQRMTEFINRSAGQHMRALKAEWQRRDTLAQRQELLYRVETSDTNTVGGNRLAPTQEQR